MKAHRMEGLGRPPKEISTGGESKQQSLDIKSYASNYYKVTTVLNTQIVLYPKL